MKTMKTNALNYNIRLQHIGGSEVAALFGLSPYLTRFELWHQKKGTILAGDFNNDRIKWGNRLEAPIAKGIAEDNDLTIKKVHRYIKHPSVKGMGASLDYEIVNHPDGRGCLEVKNVDGIVFSNQWDDDTIPMHIQLQLQHQMACSGYQWGMIAALVGGNRPQVYTQKRHEGTIAKLEQAVSQFWQSIADNQEPEFGGDDLETAKAVFDKTGIFSTDDPVIDDLVMRYKALGESAKQVESEKKDIQAQLLDRCKSLTDKAEQASDEFLIKTPAWTVKFTTIECAEKTVSAYTFKRFFFSKAKLLKKKEG
jgi:putative phage-type endonuclease